MKKVSDGGTTSGNFTYLYDGTKLRATNGAGDGFDYLGSLVYNKNGANSTLESAAFGAGRIVKTSTGYDVRYFITDHLGSVRASINQAGQVSDRSDYQLLGERWSGTGIEATTNRYQFNGKESQSPLGLNLLDYGARHYNANIARWFTPDPLAEKYNSMSPYNYCANNPIKFIDPDGKEIVLGGTNAQKQQTLSTVQKLINDVLGMARDGRTVMIRSLGGANGGQQGLIGHLKMKRGINLQNV